MLNSKHIALTTFISVLATPAFADRLRDIDVTPMPANNPSTVNIKLDVADGRDFVRINDRIGFCFTVSQSGYISLWDIGTSGKVSRIYPFSEQDTVRKVAANNRECVGNNRLRVQGPTGTENVVLYWTKDPSAQIEAARYSDSKQFISSLENSAKDAVRSGSWDDWATANVAFEIIDEYANEPTTSLGQIARTRSQYDNVYIIAFGSNVDGLKKTNDDAKLFIDMAKASLNVPSSNIRLYENAYRRDFEEGFDWVRNQVGDNDLVLFFYSGHGARIPDDENGDEADGYDEAIVPYDLENEANLNRADKFIRDDQLKDWFNSIRTGAVISIFDACHSGGMYKGFSQGALLNARSKFFNKGIAGNLPQYKGGIRKDGLMSRDIIDGDKLGNGKTKYAMLAASQTLEYALEMPNEGGVFTLKLLEGLQADKNHQNWTEMAKVVSRDVQRVTNGRQTPTYEDPDNALSELKLD